MMEKNVRETSVVKSDYDKCATSYDRVRFGSLGGRYVDEKEQEFVANKIKGSSVLEVGTATGRFALALINRGSEYCGVDISQNMLRATHERTDRRAFLFQMDGTRLGFRGYFDYVLCIRTFHFLQKPGEALKGMCDALKPSGTCVVTFETDNPFRRFLLFFGIGSSEQYYYKRCEVEAMLGRAGFQSIRSGTVMRIPVTLYRKCPGSFVWILKRLERLWPWPMHDYVLGEKSARGPVVSKTFS
jgi:ubiquinone/menaquinone biosynthesis C-methylase UbiE